MCHKTFIIQTDHSMMTASKSLFQFVNMQYFEQGFFDNSRGKTYVDLHDRVKRRMEKRDATVTETCHACMLRNSGKQFYDDPIMI